MTEPIDQHLLALLQAEKAFYSPDLPSPSVIWWKAQLMEKRRRQQQALLPIRLLRGVFVISIYLGIAILLFVSVESGAFNSTMAAAGVLLLGAHLATLWIYWTAFSIRK